jgi:protein gp37
MSDNTKIEWTDATWNPITGCSVVSAGCKHCYAMKLAGTRMRNHWSREGLTIQTQAGPVWNGQVRFNEQWLDEPLHWRKPRRIFVCAHGDLFHENVPNEWIDKVFAIMAQSPQHTFQVLTKRPERMLAYITDPVWAEIHGPKWPLKNVWLGVSVENQEAADERIPLLLQTPAAVRWLSCEPLLGNVLLDNGETSWLTCHNTDTDTECCISYSVSGIHFRGIDWVVVGGESGHGARPMHPDWARSLRDQCVAARVPFFMKQMSGTRKSAMPPIPPDLFIREYPHANA